jgi:hypothetical protein
LKSLQLIHNPNDNPFHLINELKDLAS